MQFSQQCSILLTVLILLTYIGLSNSKQITDFKEQRGYRTGFKRQGLFDSIQLHGSGGKSKDPIGDEIRDIKLNLINELNLISGFKLEVPSKESMSGRIGDILINDKKQLKEIKAGVASFINTLRNTNREKRQIVSFNTLPYEKWTLPIPYKYSEAQTDTSIQQIEKAIELYESNTCLTFERHEFLDDVQIPHILFTALEDGCYANVGRQEMDPGTPQTVNLQLDGCVTPIGTPLHEIGHAIGLYHTHTSPDRNKFLNINFDNVKSESLADFILVQRNESEEFGIPYDYGSMMHYEMFAFAKNKSIRTMMAIPDAYAITIGHEVGLSFGDVKTVNFAYCNSSCSGRETLDCKVGGYPDPHDCTQCKCPDGYSGRLCDQVAPSDQECSNDPVERAVSETEMCIESPDAGLNDSFTYGFNCNWQLTAPDGCTISFNFTILDLTCTDERSTCYHWVEIRDRTSIQIGPRFCCLLNSAYKPIYESQTNDVIITYRTMFNESDHLSGPDELFNQKGFRLCYKIKDTTCLTRSSDSPRTQRPSPTTYSHSAILHSSLLLIMCSVIFILYSKHI